MSVPGGLRSSSVRIRSDSNRNRDKDDQGGAQVKIGEAASEGHTSPILDVD